MKEKIPRRQNSKKGCEKETITKLSKKDKGPIFFKSFSQKQRNIIKFTTLFFILPSIFLSGYIITSVRDFLNPQELSYNSDVSFLKAFFNIFFTGLFTLNGFCLSLLIVFVLFLILTTLIAARNREPEYIYDEERKIKIANTGEYGNEKFMSDEDIKKCFSVGSDPRDFDSLILGKTENGEYVFVNEALRKANKNILILGSAGTGKSRAFAKCSVYQTAKRKESLIVTDPKGELFADTYKFLEKEGYDIKTLNLKDVIKSDCWNMLDVIIKTDGVDRSTILQSVSEIIVSNSSDKKDAFSSSAQSLLTSFLYILVFADEVEGEYNFLNKKENTINFSTLATKGRKRMSNVNNGNLTDPEKTLVEKSYPRTFSTIYELISLFNNDLVDAVFAGLDNKHPAKKSYMTFSKTSPNLKGNIYQNLAAMLQLFSNKEVCNIFDGVVDCLTDKNLGKCADIEDLNEFSENLDNSYFEFESKKKLKENLEKISLKESEKEGLENEEMIKIANIDILSLAKKKTALFVIMSDQNTTYSFLSSIFFSLFFEVVVKYIDSKMDSGEPSQTLTINCILDEFANIGLIPKFDKKISTIRSRRINLTIILQTITQLMNLYPNKVYSTILGNCSLTIFLGASEEETAKFISSQAGTLTTVIESQSKSLNSLNLIRFQPEYRENKGLGKRELITPQEVIKKPYEKLFVLFTGYGIAKLDKFYFDEHPDYKELEFFNVTQYTPLKDENFSKLEHLFENEKHKIKKYLKNKDEFGEKIIYEPADYKNILEIEKLEDEIKEIKLECNKIVSDVLSNRERLQREKQEEYSLKDELSDELNDDIDSEEACPDLEDDLGKNSSHDRFDDEDDDIKDSSDGEELYIQGDDCVEDDCEDISSFDGDVCLF